MKSLKLSRYLVYIFTFLIFYSVSVMSIFAFDLAQHVDIPSSFNPLGSGARALGMGGAFIAIADDATAASWNPGGLIQLEHPEMSIVYNYTKRKEDNRFSSSISDTYDNHYSDVDLNNINYLSVSYPFSTFDHNMIISLNMQHLYNFSYNGEFTMFDRKIEEELYSSRYSFEIEQDGDIYALGVAFGLQISPRISIGATLNYWGDTFFNNGWSNNYNQLSTNYSSLFSMEGTLIQQEDFCFDGWNFNLGMMWQVNDKWSIGCVFKSPFTADIDHSLRLITSKKISLQFPTDIAQNDDLNFPVNENFESDNRIEFNENIDMPMSYGIGFAYRCSDKITLSSEIYRTHWEDFIYTKQNGTELSPITARSVEQSDIDTTTWYRFGGEYLIIGSQWVVPIRAGFFYDPAPASGSPDNYYGFSLGSGVAYKRWIFDVAFTYRFGDDVGKDIFQIENIDFSKDVNEYNLYASIIVHL
ncbi:MAG: OmpP1/FadL family transporter [Desulfamplus sp.]